MEKEFNVSQKYLDKLKVLVQKHQGKTCDILFAGDSWIEYWTSEDLIEGKPAFYEEVSSYGINALNVGIGGTTFADWEYFIQDLIVPYNPKKIFISLGGNDLTQGQTVDEVLTHFQNFASKVHTVLPNVKIYVSALCHTPACVAFKDLENAVNVGFYEFVKNHDYVIILPLDKAFKTCGIPIGDLVVGDKIHLNRKGYDVWGKTAIAKLIK